MRVTVIPQIRPIHSMAPSLPLHCSVPPSFSCAAAPRYIPERVKIWGDDLPVAPAANDFLKQLQHDFERSSPTFCHYCLSIRLRILIGKQPKNAINRDLYRVEI